MSDIAVSIGPGYGALTLARDAIRSGPRVIGLDSNEAMVAGLEAGRSNIDDLTDNDIMKMKCGRFRTIADPNVIALARAVVLYVRTPLSEDGGPDLKGDRGRRERCHVSAGDAGFSRVDDLSRHDRRRGPPHSGCLWLGRWSRLSIWRCRRSRLRPRGRFLGKFVQTVVITKGPREAKMTKPWKTPSAHQHCTG
jgi:hypothetical protein